MPPVISEVFGFLGFLVRFLGFLIFGFAIGKFVWDNFKSSEWQVKIALSLGFFGLAIAITNFATAGSAGAFALGAGASFLMTGLPKKKEGEEEQK